MGKDVGEQIDRGFRLAFLEKRNGLFDAGLDSFVDACAFAKSGRGERLEILGQRRVGNAADHGPAGDAERTHGVEHAAGGSHKRRLERGRDGQFVRYAAGEQAAVESRVENLINSRLRQLVLREGVVILAVVIQVVSCGELRFDLGNGGARSGRGSARLVEIDGYFRFAAEER